MFIYYQTELWAYLIYKITLAEKIKSYKRRKGHIPHLRKPSISTVIHVLFSLLKKRKTLHLSNLNSLHLRLTLVSVSLKGVLGNK